MTLFVFYR